MKMFFLWLEKYLQCFFGVQGESHAAIYLSFISKDNIFLTCKDLVSSRMYIEKIKLDPYIIKVSSDKIKQEYGKSISKNMNIE
jgi:hypothetical protein